MINKLMITWCVYCLAVISLESESELGRRWSEVEGGDVLAWSVHITGQDTDDLTVWDDFKSVAVIPGSSSKANGDTRLDDEVWVIVERTIDSNSYTFVECFQALDWGDDPDYCWFVDAAVADGNSYALAETPAVPPAATRDEAYLLSNNNEVVWLDSDFNVLSYEIISDNQCYAVDATADGITVAGYGVVQSGDPVVTRWDTDLVADDTFFTPDAGWINTKITNVVFTSGDDFLYVKTSGVRIFKFDASNGDEVWESDKGIGSQRSIYVDDDDDFWIISGAQSGPVVSLYDADDGTTELDKVTFYNQNFTALNTPVIFHDEDGTGDIYIGGEYSTTLGGIPLWNYHLAAQSQADDDFRYWTGNLVWDILKIGSNVYASHNALTGSLHGISKFDEDLNKLAGFSPADEGLDASGGQGIWLDHDGRIAVIFGDTTSGDTDAGVYILDEDLNYIEHHVVTTDVFYANHGVNIPYLDSGTAAVPGHDVNYFPVDVVEGMEVCVYADGRPIGTRTVVSDANGTLLIDVNDTYDVVIAGINYYSIYESFPMEISRGYYSSIKNVKIDFYQSMGCNVGVGIDDSVDWVFSYDDFATSIEPVTEIKTAPFLWGTTREPIVYLWVWEPIPMTVRTIVPRVNISMD
jgi:hypothetical protein